MKLGNLFFLLVAGVLLILASCERPPQLTTVPVIEIETVEYKSFSDKADSLILTIGFSDNEGDLGVTRVEEPPIVIYPTVDGKYITYGSSDTLPPYNVCDYVINPTINGVKIEDTVYIQIDENSYNMYLKFFRKVQNEYQEFDFRRAFGPFSCFTMDGRFLSINSQPYNRPLQGSLRYGMSSHVFGTILRTTDTLKIGVRIRDNAFNKSNYVETEPFTLEGIKVN